MRTRWSVRRVDTAELLDLGQGSDQDVAENLAEMQRINDVLGGTRALTRHLYPRLREYRRTPGAARCVRVLDLGTGGAGLPKHLAGWAKRQGLALHVVGVDHSARVIAAARSSANGGARIDLLRANALCLPLTPGSFDYVISSLFLHHLPPDGVIELLHAAYRAARAGLVMSDLVRGRLPYLAFHAVAPLLARNHLTRHDGALSIRRAYTPGELRRLAEQAGLRGARVYAHFPWRMTLVVDK